MYSLFFSLIPLSYLILLLFIMSSSSEAGGAIARAVADWALVR